MTVLLPTSGRSGLKGKNRGTTPQNTEPVVSVLLVESEPARQTDNTGLDTLCIELLGSFNRDVDFTSGADNSEGLILLLD